MAFVRECPNRKEIILRLRDNVRQGIPIVGAGAGTGLSAKAEEAGGADLIILYNSGRYRMGGRPSGCGDLPVGDANNIVLELAAEVLPIVKSVPVIAGVYAHDPFRFIKDHLMHLRDLGFAGVQNFPTVGIYEDATRSAMERAGLGFDNEVEMVRIAHSLDMLTTPYAFNEKEAICMTNAGADIIVAHCGGTVGGTIGYDAIPLDQAVETVQRIHDAATKENPEVMVICHGGPIANPEDAAYLFRHTSGIAGFYGASSAERLPVEKAIRVMVSELAGIRTLVREA